MVRRMHRRVLLLLCAAAMLGMLALTFHGDYVDKNGRPLLKNRTVTYAAILNFTCPAQRSHTRKGPIVKTVLFWTTYFGSSDFNVGFGAAPFANCGLGRACRGRGQACRGRGHACRGRGQACRGRGYGEETRCVTTADKSAAADAIVFHGRDVDMWNLPPRTCPGQRWVLLLDESAEYSRMDWLQENPGGSKRNATSTMFSANSRFSSIPSGSNQMLSGRHSSSKSRPDVPSFAAPEKTGVHHPRPHNNFTVNWTMTFRRDSDIQRPYGRYSRHSNNTLSAFEFADEVETAITRKSALVCWTVSNCRTASHRESYALALAKHVPLTIFGPCPYANTPPGSCPRSDNGRCEAMISDRFKFYLAFENSYCRDYVTEKFWKVLRWKFVVPVVLGGADYKSLAPPHSYIHVGDFVTVADLADYLLYLDRNITAYRQYFLWKKTFEIRQWSLESRSASWCELCHKLHAVDSPSTSRQRRPKHYADLWEWWQAGSGCKKPPWYNRLKKQKNNGSELQLLDERGVGPGNVMWVIVLAMSAAFLSFIFLIALFYRIVKMISSSKNT